MLNEDTTKTTTTVTTTKEINCWNARLLLILYTYVFTGVYTEDPIHSFGKHGKLTSVLYFVFRSVANIFLLNCTERKENRSCGREWERVRGKGGERVDSNIKAR